MNGFERALFPGILGGSLLVVVVATLMSHPNIVLANSISQPLISAESPGFLPDPEPKTNNASEQQAVEAAMTDPGDCSLPGAYSESVRQWCGLIHSYSSKNGLDPMLIAALITQESGGNSQAYSSSGAVGLMQVMPRDGLAASFMCPAGPCFSNRPSTNELYDPEYNISYGTTMLSDLIQRYGNVRDALKAYGPKDVGYYYADIVLNIFNSYR